MGWPLRLWRSSKVLCSRAQFPRCGVPSARSALSVLAAAGAIACGGSDGHGPIADDISAPLGQPLPSATAEQRATFDRGRLVAERRFQLADGLGPTLNVTFCGSCHEKPVTGGSAGLYRNFFLAGRRIGDGITRLGNDVRVFDCGDAATPPADRVRNPPPESATGVFVGVLRIYGYGAGIDARPDPATELNHFAQRNPIPFFGAGLLAEIPDAEILKREDPNDDNGDGISGRANFDVARVGRFGRKAQTASLEGFVRGPLFNHLGITTDPLTEAQRAALPIDQSANRAERAIESVASALGESAQAASVSSPNCDTDAVLDPELGGDDLFDLVSFTMLLAAPEFEKIEDAAARGRSAFDRIGCGDCHTPRLRSPRGLIPVYSDLLLHDMGDDLADNIQMGEADGREFRTQPLWGISAVGPYLHDGRAVTISEAILAHGGEGEASRVAFEALSAEEQGELVEFLLALGGRSQASEGLVPPGSPIPDPGSYGGPTAALSPADADTFLRGRALFDRDFGPSGGAGAPLLNGDSCRACHFDPVIGGAGPRGVNVIRHGTAAGDVFTPPAVGTILHKLSTPPGTAAIPDGAVNVFEHRQTPAIFGLGLVDTIEEATITANADPNDDSPADGISGRVHIVDGGRVGRFGWKAQVPSLAEFTRDAGAAEIGLTIEAQAALTFGATTDGDSIADPELTAAEANDLTFFMAQLAPPPRQPGFDSAQAIAGEVEFGDAGCSDCHIPTLPSPSGPVALYSDLLLHEILPAATPGIADGDATMREFRTAPLWGLSQTAPYWHTGEADTIEEAILLHDGEGAASRDAFQLLNATEKQNLLRFLETL